MSTFECLSEVSKLGVLLILLVLLRPCWIRPFVAEDIVRGCAGVRLLHGPPLTRADTLHLNMHDCNLALEVAYAGQAGPELVLALIKGARLAVARRARGQDVSQTTRGRVVHRLG